MGGVLRYSRLAKPLIDHCAILILNSRQMSSFYRRTLTSGTFYYGQVKLRDGRWRTFNTHCTSKREAKEMVAGIEAEIVAGRDPFRKGGGDEGELFSGVAGRFIIARRDEWSRGTIVSREHTFRLFASGSDKPIGSIGREDVAEFRDRLVESGLSPHSVNIHLRNLRALLNWYAETEPSYRPPRIRQVKAAGASHKDALSREEARSLIEAAQSIELNGESIAPILLFLVLTGMRRSEALAASWAWIDGSLVRVPAPRTKTNEKRLVPISRDLANLLASLPKTDSDRIFPAMTIEVTRKFQDACKAAGIQRPLKLHNLRDTFIVNAIMSGIPTLLVARIVGNSPGVIDKHYAPLAEDEMKSALKRLDATGFTTNILLSESR